MTRRDFLWVTSMGLTGIILGCAVNPVTGEKQLMLMSEDQEIKIDKQNSPHQFSADYGPITDRSLNGYIHRTGQKMAQLSHRPQMPYSFTAVNATYVNAYAFPGGSIAATRGILLSLSNEAELAGLLGHEIGHVNARHTAERMTKNVLVSLALVGVAAYVQTEDARLAPLAAGLGGIGAGMLLAKYSRDDEREADALGMEYMVRSNHSPEGMVGLMNVLRGISKHKPSTIEMMFATHPMSDERYETAVRRNKTQYGAAQNYPLNRERYMDHTAKLRSMKGAIQKMQNGEKAMAQRKFQDAERQFQGALKEAPRDYAALLMMAKCQLARGKYGRASNYADKAKQVNPGEAQALHVSGMAKIKQRRFGTAYADFRDYEKTLPGNPNTIFLKGLCLEGMQRRREAAVEYNRYLQVDTSSKQAQYAYERLVSWGYVKPQQK